jgi:lipase chaperone LimK
MRTLLGIKPAWYGAALLAGVGLLWYWPGGDSATPAQAGSNDAWNGPIGAGALRGSATAEPVGDGGEPVPTGIETDGGQLTVNFPLRVVFEYFLVRGDGADLRARSALLQAHLERQLSGVARGQAIMLAQQYAAYMRAHDDLLARQQISLSELNSPLLPERLRYWLQQRTRLRESSFAPAVVQTWFGDDDAQMNTSLVNNEFADVVLRGAAAYEATAVAERQWREHLRRYRSAVAQLDGGAALGTEVRAAKLAALRNAIFSGEDERNRLQSSGIE